MAKCNCDKCRQKEEYYRHYDECECFDNHKNPHDKYDICYYKCNPCKDERNCKPLVKETNELIEKIDRQNDKVIDKLEDAVENINAIELEPIKADLELLEDELQVFGDKAYALVKALEDLLATTRPVITKTIHDAIEKIDAAETAKVDAKREVKEALELAERMDNKIDELEDAFRKTVKCLEYREEKKPMILVPKEDCPHHKGC